MKRSLVESVKPISGVNERPVTSVRFSQRKKYRAYDSYRAQFLKGKNTKQIARYFGVSESVVYNTLARVDATW